MSSEAGQLIEQVFQALPPLGSDDFLSHIETARVCDLPPEVLVRAFRQLPADSAAAEAVVRRLFRRRDGVWEYVSPLVAYARRQSSKTRQCTYEDLLQDAFRRILEALPGPRGDFAERSWNAFCRRELIDAWRERFGRRGERLPREESLEPNDEDKATQPVSSAEAPPWHAFLEPNKIIMIERVARRVLASISDEFVRAVAREAWFRDERPNISGRSQDRVSLTSLFSGKSRFQIMRALRHADAQLVAALLMDPDLELSPDVSAFLRKMSARPTRLSDSAKEKKNE